MKISKSQYPKLVKLMQDMYPDYKGRKFFLEVTEKEFDVTSYWDEGSRTYYKFVNPNGDVLHLPDTHPFHQHNKENRIAKLVPGLACVRHTIFCGHECGLTIMLHPNDMPKQISSENSNG